MPDDKPQSKMAAVVATGWVGDSIMCSAAALSLHEDKGYEVDFYIKWPQLMRIMVADNNFSTRLYQDTFLGRLQLKFNLQKYDLVVYEPKMWSHKEPKIIEIRRLAGCKLSSEYLLKIAENLQSGNRALGSKPLITLSRDIYKKAYGRDVDDFVKNLRKTCNIEWIGLDPKLSSKSGREEDLLPLAETMKKSDCFIGPEGGMLWLAGCLGVRTIYFTEHFHYVRPQDPEGDPWKSLGIANMFPNSNHIALPSYCSNQDAVEIISNALLG
jgi:hypothetical protein